MPIAGLTNLIAAAGSNKFIEPAKRNNARLRITTSNLLKLLQQQFSPDTAYLERIGKALEGDVYPLDVSFTPPAITTEVRHIYGFANATVNYGGYTTFGTCSCSFNNFIGADTYRFFYRWALLPGAIALRENGTNLDLAEPEFSVPRAPSMPLPDLSNISVGYKVNGWISQYFTSNPAEGDEIEYARWLLQGMWPSSVTTTGFDLSGDQGSMVMTSVEFAVDLALPVQGPGAPRALERHALVAAEQARGYG